jgi:cytochrome c oxidase subunit 3
MGLPLSHGKLAMWLFLVTEIMFFTGLIGMYIVLRESAPTVGGKSVWPTPHDVHLEEWAGAVNTFVLICSSLTVVLAHWALGKGQTRQALVYIGITLALGIVFLGIKAYEYTGKWSHDILPGHIGDHLAPFIRKEGDKTVYTDQPGGRETLPNRNYSDAVAFWYKDRIKGQLKQFVEEAEHGHVKKDTKTFATAENLAKTLGAVAPSVSPGAAAVQAANAPLPDMTTPLQVGEQVKQLLHDAEQERVALHLSPYVTYGNLWASCYFVMTGFHALHVFGGLVVFGIILIMAARGRFGPHNESFLELTGLYWHFVDIVWIFLFPLLYLV